MKPSNRESSARQAAEILISGSSSNADGSSSQAYGSSESQANLPSQSEVKFSSVRRMFCLFVTFDMLFMTILWILYINTSGIGKLKISISCQVNSFSIKTSMFDVVLLTAGRVVFLLLAYALIRSKHWFTVAFTTSVTCVFLVAKIVFFQFGATKVFQSGCEPRSDAQVMEYVIFLSCFVMAWIEVWILDFKVLPTERKRREARSRALSNSTQNERTPLLHTVDSRESVPDQTFYSPIDSPRGSDDESVGYGTSYRSRIDEFQSLPNSQRGSSINLAASSEDQAYLQKAKEAHVKLQDILSETEGWKMERKRENISVQSRYFDGITGKVYKLEGIIEGSVQDIFNALWVGIDDTLKWNTTVIECRLLHSITSSADIIYSVAAEGAGGVVASRDFVSVRSYEIEGNVYRCASQSVTYPDLKPVKKYVRGENGPNGWLAEPLDGSPSSSRFIWILNSDLKLLVWTPQSVLDTVLSIVVMNIFFGLREHIKSQKQKNIPNGFHISSESFLETPQQ